MLSSEGQHLMEESGSLTLATMTDSLMSVLGGTWGSVRRTQRSSSILGGLSRTRLVWRAIGEPNWREREASGIRRAEQDEVGIESYRRAQLAREGGVWDKEVVGVTVKRGKEELLVTKDEEVERCNFDKFSQTQCYWGDTVGVGSSSKLADGAAASVLASSSMVSKLGLKPLARIVGYGDAAVEPVDWPVAPALGVKQMLDRHGVTPSDIALWEINEAFAVVVIANCQILSISTDVVNIHGGAISLGHPFGMSGARIANHLALNLKPGELGVATLCNGGGGAGSMLIEGV